MKLRKEVKIGLFATIALVLLYWGINFLKGTDIFKRTHTYYAMYDQVNGLQPSSAIMIKGFKVGVIKNMSYNQGADNRIVLELNIKSKYAIPENSTAIIFSDGLMGGKAIEIQLGNSPAMLNDGDTLRSEWNKDFLEVAGSELEFFKRRINQVVNEVSTTLQSVNGILESNASHINVTMANLASLSASLNDVVSSEAGDLKAIVNNINALSATLKKNTPLIEQMIQNTHGFTDSLKSSNIPQMVDNLSTTLAKLNTSLSKVNDGEGTLGKLVSDEALYDSLTSAMSNLSLLLEDIKARPGRYVSISVFGRKNK